MLDCGCSANECVTPPALILAWWLTVSNTRDSQESADKYVATVRPINELVVEAVAEVQEQGINCGEPETWAFGPLLFTQRCMSLSIFPCESCRVICTRNQRGEDEMADLFPVPSYSAAGSATSGVRGPSACQRRESTASWRTESVSYLPAGEYDSDHDGG